MQTKSSKLIRAFKNLQQGVFIFAKYFWPAAQYVRAYFFLAFPRIHHYIINQLTTTKKLITIIAIPRGWGKTKLVSVLYTIWNVFIPQLTKEMKDFQRKKGMKKMVASRRQYVTIYSESKKKAEQILTDIMWLVTRMRFSKFYGGHKVSVRGNRWAPRSGIIEIIIRNKLTNEIVHETIIEAKGISEQIIGLSDKDARPDLIILDDIESPEAARSKDRVDKLMAKLSEEILPGISLGDRWGRQPQVVYIGTLFETDCMLGRAMTKQWEDDVNVVILPAKAEKDIMGAIAYEQIGIEEGQSLWPERMSTEKINEWEKYYIKIGQHYAFRSQYQMDASSLRKTKFELFHYIEKLEARKTDKEDNLHIIMDLASTTETHSDSVGWCITNHLPKACFIVLEGKKRKMSLDQVYDLCKEIYQKYGDRVKIILVESLQWNWARLYFTERNTREMEAGTITRPIILQAIKTTKKDDRINETVPFVDCGMIKFVKEDTFPLISELKMWKGQASKRPSSDDAADSFSQNMRLVQRSKFAPEEEGDYRPKPGHCNAEYYFREQKKKAPRIPSTFYDGSGHFS